MEIHNERFCAKQSLDQLALLYADECMKNVFSVARQMCYGCQTGHLSQTRHSCISLNSHEKLVRYFPLIVRAIDENKIIKLWNSIVADTDCSNCRSIRRLVDDTIWRKTVLQNEQWLKTLYDTVKRMIQLEARFYENL